MSELRDPKPSRACKGCGIELVIAAPNRKWCSEQCRKSQYAHPCQDCGAPRTNGSDPNVRRCLACAAKASGEQRKVWDRELLIMAIQDWAKLYGEPPAMPDWTPWTAIETLHDPERAQRFLEAGGFWPSATMVIREFGSWNNGIAAAGFTPRPAHGGGSNIYRRRNIKNRGIV
jgi:hypothetical protein